MHDDDPIIDKVLPKMLLYMSTLPTSLGLTAKQVLHGKRTNWKERVFGKHILRGGESSKQAINLATAQEHLDDMKWWTEQSTHDLNVLKDHAQVKYKKCISGGGSKHEDDAEDDEKKEDDAEEEEEEEEKSRRTTKSSTKSSTRCGTYKRILDHVDKALILKHIKDQKNKVKEELSEENQEDEDLLKNELDPLTKKKDAANEVAAELEAIRSELMKSQTRLKELANEIEIYEENLTENNTDEEWSGLLEQAKEEETKLKKDVEVMQKKEHELLSKQKSFGNLGSMSKALNDKFKEMTGLDPEAQKEAFQQNLTDALDERLGGHGFIMTMYLKLLVYLRRKMRSVAEDLVPKKAREEHAMNVFVKEGRSWETFLKTDLWKALYSSTVMIGHSGILGIIDTLFIIFKTPILVKSLLFIGRVMKNKLCVRIKLFLHSAKLDATPVTYSEMASQSSELARKFLPADKIASLLVDFLPMGKNTIEGLLKGTQATLNCLALAKVPLIGPALDTIFAFTLMAAEDTLQTLTEINFISTTIEDFYKSINYFDCLAEPLTMKLNQSWWGFKDEFKIFDMDRYTVDDRNRPPHGNAFNEYKMVGHSTPTFVSSEHTRTGHYNKISAFQENIDLLYILLADGVLELSQIQPPGLKYPIGHWTESAKRKSRDTAAGHPLAAEFYATQPPDKSSIVADVKSYTSEQTSDYQKFLGFKANFQSEMTKEKYHRELSKKYVKNYSGKGPVFVKNGGLDFAQSDYQFFTEGKRDGGTSSQQQKTFSLHRAFSGNTTNTTRKITLS